MKFGLYAIFAWFFAMLGTLIFWLAFIAGVLWLLRHFEVLS